MSEEQSDVFSLEEIKKYTEEYEKICKELEIHENYKEEYEKEYEEDNLSDEEQVNKMNFFADEISKKFGIKNMSMTVDKDTAIKFAKALKLFLIVENIKHMYGVDLYRGYLDKILTEEEKRKIKNRLNGIIAEGEKEYIEERKKKREQKRVEEKILRIEKVGGINKIYINSDTTYYDYDEDENIINLILKSINNEYKLGDSLGSGSEGEIIKIKKGFVAKICREETNIDNVYNNLKGMKTGSTAPINVFEIIDTEENVITIEISKEREKDLQKAFKKNEVTKTSVIDYSIRNIKNTHTSGIIHRDIKLENFLVDENGKVSITDYGFSINGEVEQVVSGTPAHMAPEVYYNKKTTVKSEIYSFGTVLLDIFTEGNDFFNNFLFKKLTEKGRARPRTEKQLFDCLGNYCSENNKNYITDFIEEKDIDLTNFLPKNIIDDNSKENEEKKRQLRIKILDWIRPTTALNPENRPSMDEVEKEWEEIKDFIQKEFGINKEDLLFLDKLKPENKTQISEDEQGIKKQQEIRNKTSYISKIFTKDTIETETNKLKNSLGKVLKRKVREENNEDLNEEENNEDLNEEENNEVEVLYDSENNIGNLEEALKKISEEERPLSKNANECIKILNDCIDENNNIMLPDESFYKSYNTLKNNTEEYLMVMDKLIKLRELKLAIEIERLEEIKNNIGKDNKKLEEDLEIEIKKLREFRTEVTTITRTHNNEEMVKRLFVKDSAEKLQGKESELRNIDGKMKDVYINLICDKETEHPELIPILLSRIAKEEDKGVIINQIFDKAYKNNNPKILEALLTDEKVKKVIDQKVNNNYSDYIKNAIASDCKDLAKVLIKNVFYSNIERFGDNEQELKINKESFEKNRKSLKQLCEGLKINKSKLKKFNEKLKNIEKNETIESEKYKGLIEEFNSLLGLDQQHSK